MGKLTGADYLRYWQTRIALGPDQVSFDGRDADRQGEIIWSFIEPHIKAINPSVALDFGCGYGRMLRKLHAIWPVADLYGIDICEEALRSVAANWSACGGPKLGFEIPEFLKIVKADAIFSCLVLQHITDETVFRSTKASFEASLAEVGSLVLFENVSRPGADHVRDMDAGEYMALWPRLKWMEPQELVLNGQAHALMIGVNR